MVPARLSRTRGSWENSLNDFPSGERPVWPEENVEIVSRPVKGRFGRMKLLIAKVQAQVSRPIELGAALKL